VAQAVQELDGTPVDQWLDDLGMLWVDSCALVERLTETHGPALRVRLAERDVPVMPVGEIALSDPRARWVLQVSVELRRSAR
jgi:hypothetical protein